MDNYLELEKFIHGLKREKPLVADNSADIVAFDMPNHGNDPGHFRNLVSESYRVLRKNGVFLFSLLLADEPAEEAGYLCEADLDIVTEEYKFYGLKWLGKSELPCRVINGKEIRHYNFAAFKGKEGPCMERRQAVMYNGPWSEVHDDDGHVYPRGKRVAVCDKTYNILKKAPYAGQFTYLDPYIDLPLEHAEPFPCASGILYRDPRETKGTAEASLIPAETGGTSDCTDAGCC